MQSRGFWARSRSRFTYAMNIQLMNSGPDSLGRPSGCRLTLACRLRWDSQWRQRSHCIMPWSVRFCDSKIAAIPGGWRRRSHDSCYGAMATSASLAERTLPSSLGGATCKRLSTNSDEFQKPSWCFSMTGGDRKHGMMQRFCGSRLVVSLARQQRPARRQRSGPWPNCRWMLSNSRRGAHS